MRRWRHRTNRPNPSRGRIAALALLAAASVVSPASVAAQGLERTKADLDREVIEQAAASRARGQQGAPVLVYEIADFQCPYCAQFSTEVFPRLDSAFVQSGQVQWVFVNLPLPTLHPRAWAAAEAALCAGGVGDGFWPFHDRLFSSQREWSDADDPHEVFLRYAEEADLPLPAFEDCLLGDRVASVLLEDIVFAASARVSGTPTFVIDNSQVVVGLKSYEEWEALLQEALRKKNGAPRRP